MDDNDDFDDYGYSGFGDAAPPMAPMPQRAVRREGAMPERGVAPAMRPHNPPEYVRTQGQPYVQGGPPEHHSFAVAQPNVDVYGPPPMPGPPPGPPRPHGPPPYNSQAIGQAPEGGKKSLALTLLALATGTAVGAKFGGAAGAGSGFLLSGALVNTIRASRAYLEGTPEGDREGAIAATFAAVGYGAGGYVGYKYAYPKFQNRMARNADGTLAVDDDDDDELYEQLAAGGFTVTEPLTPNQSKALAAAKTPEEAAEVIRSCNIRKVGP